MQTTVINQGLVIFEDLLFAALDCQYRNVQSCTSTFLDGLFRAPPAAADDIVRGCGQFTDAERSIVLNVRIKHLAIMIAFYAW